MVAMAALIATMIPKQVPARAAAADKTSKAEATMQNSDCFSCHAIDKKVIGPSFEDVAQRYAKNKRSVIVPKLVEKVEKGGAGDWGAIPMAPHPNLTRAQIAEMVDWILSLKGKARAAAEPSAKPAKTYSYKLSNGKTVKLDFPVFDAGRKVTADIFAGYEKYNSYCFRCHGPDAVGGEYAPDLRYSLQGGMTWKQFLTIAMEGREAKGMPKWAGFFTPEELRQIYEYVKARSVGLVAVGRPPSLTD
jgi:cytochrome c